MSVYDSILFIGRFQPFHNEHFNTVQEALSLADTVVIAIGSANRAPNIRDPWSAAQRQSMIESCFSAGDRARIRFIHVRDHMYNNTLWAANVSRQLSATVDMTGRVAIIGAEKDDTSFYLKLFPSLVRIERQIKVGADATTIRDALFSSGLLHQQHLMLPDGSREWLFNWKASNVAEFDRLCDEYRFIEKYRASWDAAPYEPTFVTTDAVVTCGDHVLLVTRKAAPGRGLWALPGGFVQPNEYLLDSAIRELREETRLKVPDPVLRGSVVASKVFDHPRRSLRGRTITHAFHINLQDAVLPKVKGGDDAANAFWVPLHEIAVNPMYEDHAFIVEHFTGVAI